MSRVYRLSILFSVFLIVLLGVWFRSEHYQPQENPSSSEYVQQAMNNQQAEDLVMTIDLFTNQVKQDLLRWNGERSNSDFDDTEWLIDEVNIHDHIDAFAVFDLETEIMKVEIGDISEEHLHNIKSNTMNEGKWNYSTPYTMKGSKKMLISLEQKNELLVSEVDISFIEHFVKEIAALSDQTGSFFVGDSNIDVTFTKQELEGNEHVISKEIPELGWNLFLQEEENRPAKAELKKGEVVIMLRDGVSVEGWIEEHDVLLLDRLDRTIVVRDLTRNTEEMIQEWYGDPTILYMEPNYVYEKQAPRQNGASSLDALTPNDEFYEYYQWNLKEMMLENAWAQSKGAANVPVAIIDSGIDPEHHDLERRISTGYNAFEDNEAYYDENGHGTHVAGIFGAVTNNTDGVAGVTWENPIMPVKVLDHEALGNTFSIAKGIRWATDNGAKVLNLSLGDDHNSEVLHDAIKYAYDKDVVIIAATGNENIENPMYPAAYEEVFAVGSLDQRNERSLFSNYGNHVDVVAPGEHIPSTYLRDEYVMMSGTSMAAPHVSGIAALLRSYEPDLSNEEIYERIRNTATDLGAEGFDPYYGFGAVNTKRIFAN